MFGLFHRRSHRAAAHEWDFPLCNTAFTGDTGSGKTTAAGAHALTAILTHRRQPAVLFTCAKVSDAPRYRRFWERHRRGELIAITAGGPHGLDPLRTYLRHPAATYYAAERMLSQAVRLADDGLPRGSGDEFWPRAASELRLAAITVTHCGYGTCDLRGLHAFLRDCPHGEEGKASEVYKQGFAFRAMKAAEGRAHRGELTGPQMRQLVDAIKHVNGSFCGTEAKCRESIRMTALTGLGPFLAEPIASLLDLDTVGPQDLERGNGILNAVGVIEHKAPGRLFACLLRTLCDEWLVSRDPDTALPVVSWQDEAHLTLVPEDVRIASICRESRLYQYRLFQTLPVAYQAVGGPHPEHLVAALYANHPLKVFHNTLCPVTARLASDLCGEKFEAHYGGSGSPDAYDLYADLTGRHDGRGMSVSWSEHKVPAVHPSVLGTLRRGGKVDDFRADALVVEAGRPWRFHTFRQLFA